ncbi:hypothetical protein PG993_008526 [Apiospora rasikravindrae]|uniref:Uncharacterized protein n=1 Tax=Apiospora rasikravindrae TaxID=990691 RepID=A0ABR1T2E4_9PEZI
MPVLPLWDSVSRLDQFKATASGHRRPGQESPAWGHAVEAAVGTAPPLAAADAVVVDIDEEIVVCVCFSVSRLPPSTTAITITIHTEILDGPVSLAVSLVTDTHHADVLVKVGAASAAVTSLVHAATI